MMSLPDFKEKQLLIINAKDAVDNKLQIQNDNICLAQDGGIVNRLSSHKIFAIFIVGDFSITTVLIRNCQQFGVSLFLLKDNFFNYSSIVSFASGNYILREKQYTNKDTFDIAKHLVMNKLVNQQILLKKIKTVKLRKEIVKEYKKQVESAITSKDLLGVEGSATKLYFKEYFGNIGWYRRLPRAKVDIINLLLDIGYTMLFNFVDAMVGLYGFDSYKGVYHTLFFQRKSLVCDLVEPFRCIIDRQLLKSFNLKQIDKKDFQYAGGKYSLGYKEQGKYVRIFSECLMDNKEDMFSFVRDYYYCIMNDNNNYPIFFIK